MALFTLEDVRFASRGKEIIRGISMKIEPRTVTCLAGKSGCGKSTLLKLISGILVPSSGRVFYKKSDIQTMSNARNRVFRRECGFVFQDSALWSNQDILQNLNRYTLYRKRSFLQIDDLCFEIIVFWAEFYNLFFKAWKIAFQSCSIVVY